MKKVKIFISIMVLLCTSLLYSEEIVLQNNDQYSGCDDTYLGDKELEDQILGSNSTFIIENNH